jgi:cellulose synthase/poly-beta-1,6-N-acetylglucosamine synthase-like glycosyltransferase
MDFGGIGFCLFAVISTLYILHFGYYLVYANLYDIWQMRRRFSRQLEAAKGLADTEQPLVTVLIPAHNEELVIVRCLDSVRASTYENLQIIVVDDASQDSTTQIVRSYIRRHKLKSNQLKLIARTRNGGKGEALNSALKRHAHGKFVMTLDADSILAPDAIGNAVSYFSYPDVVGVAANVQIIDEPTVLGILQKFEHMIGYRSKKAYSLCNCEFVIGGVASTYRMDVLRDVGFYDTDTLTEDIGLSIKIISNGNRENRLIYAADVVAATEGVDSFRALCKQRYRWKYGSMQNLVKYRRLIGNTDDRFTLGLTIYRMPVAVISELVLLFSPFIWAYVIYMTLQQYSLGLILGAYLTITIYTLITLWTAEKLQFMDRLRLSVYAPIAYFIFYLMDFVQFWAICKCLFRIRSLLFQKGNSSRWVSPRRIGREVSIS